MSDYTIHTYLGTFKDVLGVERGVRVDVGNTCPKDIAIHSLHAEAERQGAVRGLLSWEGPIERTFEVTE